MARSKFEEALRVQRRGDLDQARGLYEQVLQDDPAHCEAWNNLGILLGQKGRLVEAVRALQEAVRRVPSSVVFATNLGNQLRRAGRPRDAADAYRLALNHDPAALSALLGLGEVHREADDLETALQIDRLILRLHPNSAQALNNLGLVYLKLGLLAQGEDCLRRCLALGAATEGAPENLATLLKEQGRHAEALALFDEILATRPDAVSVRWNRSLLYLLLGRYREGWAEYEWRFQGGITPSRRLELSQPEWNGEPLKKKTILVYAEQGLGDTIQFVRFLPRLRKLGAHVIFVSPPELVPLVATMPGLEVRSALQPAERFDYHIALMSLPRVLQVTLDDVGIDGPYLEAPGPSTRRVSPKGPRRVGIVWRGNPKHRNDRARSIPLERMLDALRVPGVELVSLQHAPGPAEEALLAAAGVAPFPATVKDFADTARLLTGLERVVTVDTSMAHLAGALGRPAWVLLPFSADWRWLVGREDSPWYPTLRLFRQDAPRSWDPVLARVASELATPSGPPSRPARGRRR